MFVFICPIVNPFDSLTSGRKRVFANSARKRNRQNIHASYNINIGVQSERWNELKDTRSSSRVMQKNYLTIEH